MGRERADHGTESSADSKGGNPSIAPWVNPKSHLMVPAGFGVGSLVEKFPLKCILTWENGPFGN